jgi:hypothetical protein
MIRVKTALIALTVCPAVGGALAFKANNFGQLHLYTTGGVTPNNGCTVDFGIFAIGVIGHDPTVYASKHNGGTCTTITYTIQP